LPRMPPPTGLLWGDEAELLIKCKNQASNEPLSGLLDAFYFHYFMQGDLFRMVTQDSMHLVMCKKGSIALQRMAKWGGGREN
jgi:hypothetical protein